VNRAPDWILFPAAAWFWLAAPAQAEVRLWEREGFKLDLALTATTGYFHTESVNFGAGRREPDGTVDTRVHWAEGFIEPVLKAAYDSDAWGTLYGGLGYVGALTRGEGDAGGFTRGTAEDIATEHLYFGWRSGQLFPALGENAIDLSYGRQEFRLGEGFILSDGNLDIGAKGTYFLMPRTAFERAALLRFNLTPVRADLFYLSSDADQANTELAGINLEYVEEALGTFGISYFHITDSASPLRNGMHVLSLRGKGRPLDPHVFLAAEYVLEEHSGAVQAHAWYVEAGYTWVQGPGSPGLHYRFSHYSGDDPISGENESFDPLFYDPLFYTYNPERVWGTWTQGEITGAYLLFNSNLNIHMVQLKPYRSERVDWGVIY
jgi:hypothetical protein